jgi:hypothetical protein
MQFPGINGKKQGRGLLPVATQKEGLQQMAKAIKV